MTATQAHSDTDWPRTIAKLGLLLGWILFWYRDSFLGMVRLWESSDTYAHGFVVVPLALWLCWIERQHIRSFSPRLTAIFLPLILVATFAWMIGELATVNIVPQFAAMMILIMLIVSVIGIQLGSELAFPLAFLLFAVPFGEFLMPTLMSWTADFTVLALRATGIPVFREGLSFVIPSGHWSVVEACSGIRYIIASLMVGTLFAYLNYQSLKRRLTFMLAALLVPILANWLRAYLIVLLGHLSGNKLAAGVDHLIYGWVFFGLVIGVMFAIGIRWAEPRTTASIQLPSTSLPHRPTSSALVVPLLLLITAAGPLGILFLDRTQADTPTHAVLNVTVDTQSSVSSPDWTPAWANPSLVFKQSYATEGPPVLLYIAYYRNQNPSQKLISSTNMLVKYQDSNWSIIRSEQDNLKFGDTTLTVRTAELVQKSPPSIHLRTHHWYWIGGQFTSNDAKGKLLTAINRLLGHGDHSAVIVLATEDNGNAAQRLQQFASANGKSIEKSLDQLMQAN